MEKKTSFKPILIGILVLVLTAGIVYAIMSTGSKKTEKAKTETKTSETSTKGTELKDGEYEGTAKGYAGDITVKVIIKEGKISDIKVVSQNETPGYYENGVKVLDRIIKANSVEVDSISGATVTSDALKLAVQRALVKAGAKESDVAKKIEEHKNNVVKGERTARARRAGNIARSGGGAYIPRNSKFRDGTYTASSMGYNGPIRVSVTIRNGKIANVRILSHREDNPYFSWAKRILSRVVNRTDANVNTVSGATYSSRGIINAINKALSKAIYTPDEIGKDDGKNGPKKPDIEDDEDDNSNNNKPSTPEEKSEMEKVKENTEKAIAALIRNGDLKNGKYNGVGGGFNTSKGNLKSETTIEDNKIKDIVVADGKDYADDFGEFRVTAIKLLPFLKDENKGRRNIAVMKLHRDYIDIIMKDKNPKKKAEELIGKKYANKINQFGSASHVSQAIKEYLAEEHGNKEMFDTVSGATISAGGIARTVDNALELSENDAKTGNKIVAIRVVEPTEINIYTKQAVLKANSKKPLDLSELKVELENADGTKEKVSYADFEKKGIEIVSKETGEKITQGMDITEIAKKGALITTIRHKASKRSTELGIQFGAYSKDYVKEMEYSLDDGATWKKIENPGLSDENNNNIADRQTIKLPRSDLGKKIKFRTKTISGQIYNYASDEGIEYRKMTFNCVDDSYKDNANASFALFITINEDKSVQPPVPGGNETEVGAEDLNAVFKPVNLNHQKFEEVTVTKGDNVTIESVEGLPNGLKFENGKITGSVDVNDSEFLTVSLKTYEIKLHGKKDGKAVSRTVKMDVYQDKDRDGVSANDEGVEQDDQFTPLFKAGNKIEKKQNDPAPTIDEYKALFKNIPDDDSVTIEVEKQPDMSVKKFHVVKLKFKSKYASKVGTKSVGVQVK